MSVISTDPMASSTAPLALDKPSTRASAVSILPAATPPVVVVVLIPSSATNTSPLTVAVAVAVAVVVAAVAFSVDAVNAAPHRASSDTVTQPRDSVTLLADMLRASNTDKGELPTIALGPLRREERMLELRFIRRAGTDDVAAPWDP